jgi:hypothetical protein
LAFAAIFAPAGFAVAGPEADATPSVIIARAFNTLTTATVSDAALGASLAKAGRSDRLPISVTGNPSRTITVEERVDGGVSVLSRVPATEP